MAYQCDRWSKLYGIKLQPYVQSHFNVRVTMMRDVVIDGWRIIVQVMNRDMSFHGQIEETVQDPDEFPTPVFITQLTMLAG
jgi:hypothetical protein